MTFHRALHRTVHTGICTALAIGLATSWAPAWSQHSHGDMKAPASNAKDAGSKENAGWSTATIKKVDTAKRRLLLAHGPIPNLGMSGMTMGFEVSASVDLNGLNAGDSILFKADQIKGQYTVTDIKKP